MDNKIQELIRQHKAIEFGNFKLRSGESSKVYVNARKLTSDGVALFVICSEMIDRVLEMCPDVQGFGGAMSGSDMIVGGIISLMGSRGKALKGFLVRKETKDHGLGRKIEGEDGFSPGMKVAVVEDVTTTGDSAFKAVLAARSMKCEVVAAISIVDREQDAAKMFEEQGVKFLSLAKLSEFR